MTHIYLERPPWFDDLDGVDSRLVETYNQGRPEEGHIEPTDFGVVDAGEHLRVEVLAPQGRVEPVALGEAATQVLGCERGPIRET